MLRQAAELVARARMGVAFTGAGISAESGISTFRGRDGLWRRYDPYQVSSIEAFVRDPGRYWRLAAERWEAYAAARPNPGHLALAALEAAGHLRAVVTQNTDGLHRDAGTRRLVELHGNGRRVRCLDCGAVEERAAVQARLRHEMPPRCGTCTGMHLKPEVVLFGEPLPALALMEAFELARGCDLMLVVGSSLQVYPAADVPSTAVERGVPLIVVNDEPTPVDVAATVVLRGRSGELLPRLEAEVRRRREAGDTAAPSRSPSSDGRGTSS